MLPVGASILLLSGLLFVEITVSVVQSDAPVTNKAMKAPSKGVKLCAMDIVTAVSLRYSLPERHRWINIIMSPASLIASLVEHNVQQHTIRAYGVRYSISRSANRGAAAAAAGVLRFAQWTMMRWKR